MPRCARRAPPTSCTAGRHRHEPQRDTALTRVASTADAPPGDGSARAVLRRRLRVASHGLSLGTGHARRARPSFRLRLELHGRARSVRLPAALAPGQRLVFAQVRARGAAPVDRPGRPPARRVSSRRPAAIDEFLSEHAVIAMADHSQTPITEHDRAPGRARGAGGARTLRSSGASRGEEPRIAVCPSQRAAMVYALHESERDAMRASVVTRALAIDGVEHVMWLARDAHDVPREGIISSPLHGELRFCPGGSARGCARRAGASKGRCT